ncbi:MAG: SDR family oxidoreductase [Alphaproteobacteria bacterium]|nr:SDR family oxidoreductase [Alphaproteobacteria bacterium]
MVTQRFEGRTAYVTGGSRGIGWAICKRLSDEGATVVNMDLASALPQSSGGAFAHGIAIDISDRASIADAFDKADKAVGPPDAFVACAGKKFGSGSFENVDDETWDQYISINLTGTFTTCRAAARAMIDAGKKGRIVTVGSVNSFMSEANVVPYASSKGGILMLTKAMAVDLAKHGITANMIAPGPIAVLPDATDYKAEPVASEIRRNVALMRAGVPAECAGAVAYLASDDADFVTGSTITVDGGTSAMVFGGTREF